MGPPVVIDVGLTDPAPEVVAALVEACTRAVADTECHLLRDAPQTLYRAIAIVTWESADRVRIEVGVRRDQGTDWRVRSLAFQAADVELERFRSVGFVVGTLAGEGYEAEAPPPPTPPPPPPPVRVVPRAPPKPAPRRSPSEPVEGFVGAAGTLGGALSEGGPRGGGALRFGVGLSPLLLVVGSAGVSVRPRDDSGLSLQWLDAGFGIGLRPVQPKPFGFEVRLEAAIEQFQAQASAAGSVDARQRVLVLGRLGADAVFGVLPPLSVVLGADGIARPAATTVRVGGRTAGTTGLLEVGIAAGVRLSL